MLHGALLFKRVSLIWYIFNIMSTKPYVLYDRKAQIIANIYESKMYKILAYAITSKISLTVAWVHEDAVSPSS